MKRRRHTAAYRKMALRSADKHGVVATAKSLRLNPSVIYRWRKEAKAEKVPESFKRALKDVEAGRMTGGTWSEPDKWQITTSVQSAPKGFEASFLAKSKQIDYIKNLEAEIGRLHMLLCRKV